MHVSPKKSEMAIKHMQRRSASLVLRERQLKYTMKYHLTLINQNDHLKKSTSINSKEGVERREPSYTVGGNVNQYTHQGEHYGGS